MEREIMNDHDVLNRMQEMCEESCNPDQFEEFMKLKEYLISTRLSLHLERKNRHTFGILVPKSLKDKVGDAVSKAIRNPNSSKSAKTKAGSALSRPLQSYKLRRP